MVSREGANLNRPLRLARVVTTSVTFSTLLYDQIAAIRDAGIQVTLISNDAEQLFQVAHAQGVASYWVPMSRQPDLSQDVHSQLLLIRFLYTHQFDIVHSTTPKAGLLTAIAGALSGTPIRLHTYTGQRWVTLDGMQRQGLRFFDRLIGTLSTITYADSASQRQFLVDECIVRPQRIQVLGPGSISGVNLERFDPNCWGGQVRADTRASLGIPSEALVIAFVGRVTRDKGIVELIRAFADLSARNPNLFLLLVGPFEPELDPVPIETQSIIEMDARIRSTGFCSNPERYLGAADIFCLPSYREGFGTVVIEAGAMELPTVATSVSGLMDAVQDGETGLLVAPADSCALAEALEKLITRPDLRASMGAAARKRAEETFDAKSINQTVIAEYRRLATRHLAQHSGLEMPK
jgi:glycosyltransferase involved in cell wall biosynthesis